MEASVAGYTARASCLLIKLLIESQIMLTPFPFADFAASLTEEKRDVFASFAGALPPDIVLAHIRSQHGLEKPRAAPPAVWHAL